MTTSWTCTFDDELSQLAIKHGTDKLKWYTSFYHELLKDRRAAQKVMELGIGTGASLRMWREYFPEAQIYGLDRNVIPIPGVTTMRFEQSDPETYPLLCDFDFIVEDASHQPADQLTAMLELAPRTKLYVIEDTGYMEHEELLRFAANIPYPYEVVEFVNPELQNMGDRGSCIVVRP